MSETRIFEAIAEAIREETENPDMPVGPTTTASEVPGWDSLAHARIVLGIEARLGGRIDISDTYKAANVGELAEIIRATLTRQGLA